MCGQNDQTVTKTSPQSTTAVKTASGIYSRFVPAVPLKSREMFCCVAVMRHMGRIRVKEHWQYVSNMHLATQQYVLGDKTSYAMAKPLLCPCGTHRQTGQLWWWGPGRTQQCRGHSWLMVKTRRALAYSSLYYPGLWPPIYNCNTRNKRDEEKKTHTWPIENTLSLRPAGSDRFQSRDNFLIIDLLIYRDVYNG